MSSLESWINGLWLAHLFSSIIAALTVGRILNRTLIFEPSTWCFALLTLVTIAAWLLLLLLILLLLSQRQIRYERVGFCMISINLKEKSWNKMIWSVCHNIYDNGFSEVKQTRISFVLDYIDPHILPSSYLSFSLNRMFQNIFYHILYDGMD